AYVYDPEGMLRDNCNPEMVSLSALENQIDEELVKTMVEKHVNLTGSALGKGILDAWDSRRGLFVKVMPTDYRRALDAMKEVEAAGITGDEAVMAAFYKNIHDPARVSGN
ncbi:MAG: hypothetical protein HGA70_08110, partial [Chlorobiaceae bacterium]|nr:hypothetical protein [Chlorobiaceae bacterium]